MSQKRKTRQYSAIQKQFETTQHPLNPEEVLKLAQDEVPGLGIATVYRTLKRLQEEGEIKAINMPDGSTFFERIDLDHHHHFSCNDCGMVLDIPSCPVEGTGIDHHHKPNLPEGFTLQSHEIFYYGVCSACAK